MSIAAASILAKVTRDRLLLEYDKKYPLYEFAKHKGYGTKLHIDLLKQHGPSEIHRLSFLKNIFGDKNLVAPDMVKTIPTDAPYIADKIYQLKTQYWNECLTRLGISNVNIQKKERLISDEVTRAMGGVIASRYSRLEMRRQAADAINKMFNLDIEVDYREDYRQTDDEFMIEGMTGETGGRDPMVIDQRTRS